MRKFIFSLFLTLLFANFSVADENADYVSLYNQTSLVDFKFVHDIDPWQDEDYFKYAWSPYPAFRMSTDLFFKNEIHIPAGYYLLTPRNYKNRDVILFKEAGKVKFIVPVVQKELVPVGFYETNVPRPIKTGWENFKERFANFWYKIFKTSKKEKPPECFINAKYTTDRYMLVDLYYGSQVYSMVFKTEKN